MWTTAKERSCPAYLATAEEGEQRQHTSSRPALIFMISSPRNSKIKGRFQLGAEVDFKLMRVPISKREDEIVDVEYDLSG